MSRQALMYVSIVIFILGFITVGLLSAVVYAYNIQRCVGSDNVMMNKAQTSPIIMTTGHQIDIISSEINAYDLAKIQMVNIVLGSDVNTTSYSLRTTGFVKFLCQHECDSTHVLHVYTNDALIDYHGNTSYVAEPSARLLNSLTHHNSPVNSTLSKTLFQPHMSSDHVTYSHDSHRKLIIPFVAGVLFRPLVSYVVKKVAKEVVKEVASQAVQKADQCVYNRYTQKYTC